MSDARNPRSTTPTADHGEPVRDEREVVREEQVVRTDRRGGGLSDLLGGIAKAGLWMVLGAILVVVLLVIALLALIF